MQINITYGVSSLSRRISYASQITDLSKRNLFRKKFERLRIEVERLKYTA